MSVITPSHDNRSTEGGGLLSPAIRDTLFALAMAAYLLIFPAYARSVQRSIRDAFGGSNDVFYWLFGGGALLALAGLVWWVWTQPPTQRKSRAIGLLVTSIFLAFVFYRLKNPVEWEHILKYSFMTILAFRAVRHGVSNAASLVYAACLAGAVGALEEAVQWQLPDRVGEVRDVLINLEACLIGVGIIVLTFQPPEMKRWPSWRLVGTFPAAIWSVGLVVAMFLHLAHQWGHIIEIDDKGSFHSIFSVEDLRQADAEFVQLLVDYNRGGDPNAAHHHMSQMARDGRFVAMLPDVYFHEAQLHHGQFLRWRGEEKGQFQAAIQYRMLTEYFPHMVDALGWRLDPETEQAVLRHGNQDFFYRFRHPKKDLFITSFTRAQMWSWVLWSGAFALLGLVAGDLAERRFGSRKPETP